MTARIDYRPPSNAELDRRVRALAIRKGKAETLRVLNVGELSDAERDEYGFDADWTPGSRRTGRAGRSR